MSTNDNSPLNFDPNKSCPSQVVFDRKDYFKGCRDGFNFKGSFPGSFNLEGVGDQRLYVEGVKDSISVQHYNRQVFRLSRLVPFWWAALIGMLIGAAMITFLK